MADLMAEARSWGLAEPLATKAVRPLLEAIPPALTTSARALGWDTEAATRMLSSVRARTSALLDNAAAGHHDPTLDVYERARSALDAAASITPTRRG